MYVPHECVNQIQTLPRKMITQENDKFEWRNNKKTNLENDYPGK